MSRNVLLNKSDYEFYNISIPLSFLGGKRQKKYIAAELCKRHPCFSDEFCFDVHVDLKKNGFLGNVIVMNKYKLTEIRRKNPHKSIAITERKIPFFNEQLLTAKKITLLCFCMSLLLLLLCLFFGRENSKQNFEEQNAFVPVSFVEADESDTPKVDAKKVFEIIQEKKGVVSRLEWKLENQNELFVVSVAGLYPEFFLEPLKNISISAVSYSKDVPLMVVQANGFYNAQNCVVQSKEHFVPFVRDVLKENNCAIKEENVNSITFSFLEHEADCTNVVLKLSEVLKENNISITYLLLTSVGKSMFDVQLEFSDNAAQTVDLELVGKNLGIFMQPLIDKPTVPIVSKKEPEKSKGVKLGEVTYSDGRKLVFYKTAFGKTVKEVEFNNEK